MGLERKIIAFVITKLRTVKLINVNNKLLIIASKKKTPDTTLTFVPELVNSKLVPSKNIREVEKITKFPKPKIILL